MHGKHLTRFQSKNGVSNFSGVLWTGPLSCLANANASDSVTLGRTIVNYFAKESHAYVDYSVTKHRSVVSNRPLPIY